MGTKLKNLVPKQTANASRKRNPKQGNLKNSEEIMSQAKCPSCGALANLDAGQIDIQCPKCGYAWKREILDSKPLNPKPNVDPQLKPVLPQPKPDKPLISDKPSKRVKQLSV